MIDQSNVRLNLLSAVECPVCRSKLWREGEVDGECRRCGYVARREGSLLFLLPERLSANNAREADSFEDFGSADAVERFADSVLVKPFDYPTSFQMFYRDCATLIRRMASGLGPSPSVLFTCAGGGMEAHLSGLVGSNVVLSDISAASLRVAERRFDAYGLPQPAFLAVCDAEHLPFADNSFDLVVASVGIHHCLVPQAALYETWRVARRRSLVIDNYECALTRILNRFELSSNVEHSGVLPNRFTRGALNALLHNAGIKNSYFRPLALSPTGVARRLGTSLTRMAEAVLANAGQTNMFALATSSENEDLASLFRVPIPAFDPNPSRRLPNGASHSWPA